MGLNYCPITGRILDNALLTYQSLEISTGIQAWGRGDRKGHASSDQNVMEHISESRRESCHLVIYRVAFFSTLCLNGYRS